MKELEAIFYALETKLMHYRLNDFEKILAEDFLEFGTSGTIYDKNAHLNLVNEEGMEEVPFIITNFRSHLLADNVAHITYQTESKIDGMKSLRSSIWRLEDADWKLSFHQGTRTI